MRSWAGMAVLLAAFAAAAPVAAAPVRVATLGAGDAAFWDGGYVGSANVADAAQCGPCFTYEIAVTAAHGRVLRVAIDSVDASNNWTLQLLNPAGDVVASEQSYESAGLGQRNDVELFAHDPAPGTWTARVLPTNVKEGSFVARAALDWVAPKPGCTVPVLARRTLAKARRLLARAGCALGAVSRPRHAKVSRLRVLRQKPAAGEMSSTPVRLRLSARRPAAGHARVAAAAGDVLPDLAPDPPWELTFDTPTPQAGPLESGNLTAALLGIHHPTATVGGQHLQPCLIEESLEQQAQRCLRFSSGVASLGPGRFEVYGAAQVPVAVGGGPLTQVIQRADGTTRGVEAGQFSFHQVHLHYHVLDLAQFPLFRMAGDHMEPVGRGLKEGFCLGNIKLYSWRRFDADPVDPNTIDNCEPNANPSGITQLAPDAWRFYEGIANGWVDIYTWATSGQYVDFANLPDGTYVLQMIVNSQGRFLESDTTNNVAYTEFEVSGDVVRIVERGRGTGPFDPDKQLLGVAYTRS